MANIENTSKEKCVTLINCRLWHGNKPFGKAIDCDTINLSSEEELQYVLAFVERNTRKGWCNSTNGEKVIVNAYPKEAIREALTTIIAIHNYTSPEKHIDIDIYFDRIEFSTSGSLLHSDKVHDKVPSINGSYGSSNAMERYAYGLQAIESCYSSAPNDRQPCIMFFPKHTTIKLSDILYQADAHVEEMTETERVIELLKEGPKFPKELQAVTSYKSRSRFINDILTPLIEKEIIKRNGNPRSPNSTISLY